VDLVVTFGASSSLARQIEQGAPADVFLSASPEWTGYLRERRRLRVPSRPLFRNRLVVVGPPEAPALRTLDDLRRFERIALADTSHVPAGRYARAGLEQAGLWAELEGRVIPTADVRAAVAAVEGGAADVAVVYASDLRAADRVRELLAWPERFAPDIRYMAALPRGAPQPDRALELVEWLRQPERAALWRRYGFVPLAEPTTS
ncbi:MAG: molybdate ABC transporter substrate-binding protein, partial [Rhodothermales bacterium]|nr:molybdate ABC transporter substrate-binding protein [Rhodothermales bacterium]